MHDKLPHVKTSLCNGSTFREEKRESERKVCATTVEKGNLQQLKNQSKFSTYPRHRLPSPCLLLIQSDHARAEGLPSKKEVKKRRKEKEGIL